MKAVVIGLFALLFNLAPTPGWSVETAPRISDREIVERLTRLEEGQKALAQRIDNVERSLGQRIDNVERSLGQRIDNVERSLGQRIDELRVIMLWGFGVMFSGMFALVGFVLWDRRSPLAPAVRQVEGLKEREDRLEAALREYARTAPELADVLRKLGLL
ncbi:MAG: hypothetical protein HYZ50_20555 [Deltaproteobacteria bacterium]|nr:hypothetical protein [Deltaproteobacteria bacterium]